MDRRSFLAASGALSAAAALAGQAVAARDAESPSGSWRSFEVTSRVEILDPEGVTQLWMPLPSVDAPAWVRNEGDSWSGNALNAELVREKRYGAGMLHAVWQPGEAPPVLEVVSRFSARDRSTDFSSPSHPENLEPRLRVLYTAATELMPTDGLVRKTAAGIVGGVQGDVGKARSLYQWIVENTFRNPKTRGCGLGNIRFMLESGDLGGKCADLNALYVGLCRSIGIPARDVYGIRVADSRQGYKSLGRSGDISKAQHCRAEVWLTDYGWVPVDPADVRKVILEEKPGLTLHDPLVAGVREKLFGAWEMNWMPYNTAHDVELPGSKGPPLGFLMYPHAETGGRRLDSLDPERFRYALSARETGT